MFFFYLFTHSQNRCCRNLLELPWQKKKKRSLLIERKTTNLPLKSSGTFIYSAINGSWAL